MDSSTRLSVVLTLWPPGPEEREKRSVSSAAGMDHDLVTTRSSAKGVGERAGPGVAEQRQVDVELPLDDQRVATRAAELGDGYAVAPGQLRQPLDVAGRHGHD